ncbi:MAG: hypothetical protein HYV07_21130 [Deltaproteobacteria bacterium]|nr:hypothetical protein [Deltaproteobacteria bacterium]
MLELSLGACSPGIGRPPAYPDAAATVADANDPRTEDASGPRDAGTILDARVPDAQIVVLRDGGFGARYPLTGIFRSRDGTVVYAREIDGNVSLVLDQHPYLYIGLVDAAGNFDAVSPPLLRSGCPAARVTGSYDRSGSILTIEHTSCRTTDGQPFTASLTATFLSDFSYAFSGVYELNITNVQDPVGCLVVQPGTPRWGINLLEDTRTVAVYAAADPEPAMYLGSFDPSTRKISAIQRLSAGIEMADPSLNVQFFQISLNDPLTIAGERDVVDIERSCAYRVSFEGIRIELP